MNRHFFKPWFAIVLLLVLVACKKEQALTDLNRGAIVTIEEVGWISVAQVAQHVEVYDVAPLISHNLRYFVVDYRTVIENEPVDARGLLMIPEGLDSLTLAVYTHGTLFPVGIDRIKNQLASNYRGSGTDFFEVRNIAMPLAASGFAVFMPDYVGFSISDHKEHPYVYYPELFNGILDGARAASKAIGNLGFYGDNRLFLYGWSQGAGACVSAHRFIERDFAGEFQVVASSGLAGPYNFSRFINFVFENQDQEFPYLSIYSWGMYCLNKFSGLKRPTDQIFAYPVYDQWSALLVQSLKPKNVFNMFFVDRIVNLQDVDMVNIISDNCTHNNWQPQGKVFLHHGTADDIVPYFNSVDAYNGLSALGGDVTLYTYPSGGHTTEAGNFVSRTIHDFNLLK